MRRSDRQNIKDQNTKKKKKIKRQQHGGFLNWYHFAYAGWDTFSQAMNRLDVLAPELIGQTLKEINKIAKIRIKQIMNQGGSNSKNNSTNR